MRSLSLSLVGVKFDSMGAYPVRSKRLLQTYQNLVDDH